jgi:hypothetical protein
LSIRADAVGQWATIFDRQLKRTRATIRAGPAAVLRWTYLSVAGTCALALAFLFAIHGPKSPPTRIDVAKIIFGSLLVASLTALVGDLVRRGRHPELVSQSKDGPAVAAVLALTIWFPLLLLPTYLLARSSQPSREIWLEYEFLDKRWIVALFLLGALAAPICLSVGGNLARRARAISTRPVTDRSRGWSTERYAILAAKLIVALGLAWLFFGPPWAISPNGGQIDYHEDVHLGGLQAIANGATPYVDQASVQYGPGTQLLSYLYMHHVGGVSIIGFRQSFALFHWVGASVFFVALFLRLPFSLALASSVVAAIFFPTLQLFQFASDRSYTGFFGWGNIWRYLGAFLLIMFLPLALDRTSRTRARLACVLLGLVWAITTWLAQENLLAGFEGLVVLAFLLALSGTVSSRRVMEALIGVGVGFLALWTPILVFYASRGKLADFSEAYFLFPKAVASGYSNAPYLDGFHSPWGPMYYFLPFVLIAAALVGLVQTRPFDLAAPWSQTRVLFVSLVVVSAVSFQGALLRSDSSHLFNTILAVPVLLVVAVAELPRLLGLNRPATRWLVGAALALGAGALIAQSQLRPVAVRHAVVNPIRARLRPLEVPDLPAAASPARRRVGKGLARGPVCCTASTVSMNDLIRFMDRLHRLLGSRPTYVASFRDGYPGLVYFLANLKPAPFYLEQQMVINLSVERKFLAYFRHHFTGAAAVVSMEPTSREISVFRTAYPHARRTTLHYRGAPLYVFIRRTSRR